MDARLQDRPIERRIELPARGGEMAGLEFGPPDRPVDVVFLHANGFNARTYASILGPLAPELRILALDQRGHGRTRLPTETEGRTSWDGLRDDLIAALEALDLTGVVLSGHSMGGTVGLLAQARTAKRVKAMVLFDPVIMPPELTGGAGPEAFADSPLVQGALRRRAIFPGRQAAVEAYTGRGAFKTWSPQMLADYVQDGFLDRPDGQVELACSPQWEASSFTSHGHDTWDAFRKTTVPIRILRAAEGSTCREHPLLEALIRAGRIAVETVPGTSHFLPMERPDLVQAALREAAR